jgi:hypothetical protein
MATLVTIKNLSRRRIRFGKTGSLAPAAPTGTGASLQVDADDPYVKKDLYKNLGSYAFAPELLTAKIALIAANAAVNGGAFAWANAEAQPIFVHRAVLDVTSAGLATSTVDVGSTSTALGAADVINIFSAQAISATGTFVSNNVAKLAAADFVSGTVKTANGTGLVGFIYLHYSLV